MGTFLTWAEISGELGGRLEMRVCVGTRGVHWYRELRYFEWGSFVVSGCRVYLKECHCGEDSV